MDKYPIFIMGWIYLLKVSSSLYTSDWTPCNSYKIKPIYPQKQKEVNW